MAGNELEVCKFLLANIGNLRLNHIGVIYEIAAPLKQSSDVIVIKSENDLSLISTQDSRKKADVYLNKVGVSIKQTGGSFAFNRLQRANIINFYQKLGLIEAETKLALLDKVVTQFHQGLLKSRNVSWQDFFSEPDFKNLLKFLMLIGSPNLGISNHPAQYILEASTDIAIENISLFTKIIYQ